MFSHRTIKHHFSETPQFFTLQLSIHIMFVFFRVKRWLRSTALTRRFGMVENIALNNPAYERLYSIPVKPMVSPQAVQQPDSGFGNLHIGPGGHYQTLDNVNK